MGKTVAQTVGRSRGGSHGFGEKKRAQFHCSVRQGRPLRRRTRHARHHPSGSVPLQRISRRRQVARYRRRVVTASSRHQNPPPEKSRSRRAPGYADDNVSRQVPSNRLIGNSQPGLAWYSEHLVRGFADPAAPIRCHRPAGSLCSQSCGFQSAKDRTSSARQEQRPKEARFFVRWGVVVHLRLRFLSKLTKGCKCHCIYAMTPNLGQNARSLVVPKALRDRLSLEPGDELEVSLKRAASGSAPCAPCLLSPKRGCAGVFRRRTPVRLGSRHALGGSSGTIAAKQEGCESLL